MRATSNLGANCGGHRALFAAFLNELRDRQFALAFAIQPNTFNALLPLLG